MKIKQKFYPHPVLTYYSDDIIESSFDVQMKPLIKNKKLVLTLKPNLENNELLALINNGLAEYLVHCECKTTRYRNVIRFSENEYSTEIPVTDLDGEIEICFFIIAKENIRNYKNKFNSDFGKNSTFEVFKYDTLAIAEGKIVPIKKNSNKKSICEINCNDKEDAPPFQYFIDSPKIQIFLRRDNYDNFYKLSKGSKETMKLLMSQTIFPALVGIFEILASEETDTSMYEQLTWYETIKERLKTFGIDIADKEELKANAAPHALKVIGDKSDPFTDSLKWLFESN